MARITCAISGLTFSCDHMPIVLNSRAGYFHPIFALPYKKLYGLYSKHCSGHLTSTDSYLLFLAFLHSTEQVEWTVPASLIPREKGTIQLIENNLAQLIEVVELSNVISHPSFKQPCFKVTPDTSNMRQIAEWILIWYKNIEAFRTGYKNQRLQEDLQKVENRLSYCIKSGNSPESYSQVVAAWADKAGGFPPRDRDNWMCIIRSCFNSNKMFSTPIADLKAVKAFCEENIEVGSIHFHTLMQVLREGISRHTDFLGMSPAVLGYTLLPIDSTKNDEAIAQIVAAAPADSPKRADYPTQLDYLKAKLRFRTAQIQKGRELPTVDSPEGEL